MIAAGETISGFLIVSVQEIPEYEALGIFCRHKTTGLEVYHVCNDDEENLFSFNFKTAPKNSKGTAHIVEHAVLAGSEKYPVKDPFREVMKGSAQTFLNAITYPDRTLYPGASPIRQDYFNLMEVYGDAVFFPLLRKETFQQEGIRIEADNDGDMVYQGIVYNEMKGAYSSHDAIVSEHSLRLLFPDTPLNHDSGGDPREIIKLTYEEFKGFHASYYHPSNCKVFLYGNIATEEQLKFLHERFLSGFTSIKVNGDYTSPMRWKKPKRIHVTSPAESDEAGSAKSTITVNWVVGSGLDPVLLTTYEVITEFLLGNPGAPMYQEIIDSGIGEDIASISGMESELRDIAFFIGVRGADPDKTDEFESLVLNKLSEFAEKGIPDRLIQSAMRKIEFQQRELKGGIPVGLRCLIRSLRGWIHGLDPAETLRFLPAMQKVKELWQEDPLYFSTVIRDQLMNNPHRITVVVTPSHEHQDKLDRHAADALETVRKRLTKKDYLRLQEEQASLLAFQQASDPEDALEKIPYLSINDLPKHVSTIDTRVEEIHESPCLIHDYHTNGICYLDYIFSFSGLTSEEVRLMPLFSRLIYMTSMPGKSYADVSSELSEVTGGFYSFLEISSPLTPLYAPPKEFLTFRSKFLAEDISRSTAFIHAMLTTANVNDVRRIKDIIVEARNDFSMTLIPSGNMYASLRSEAYLSGVQAREDMLKGIDQMLFLHEIDVNDQDVLADIGRKLELMRTRLFTRKRFIANITCPGEMTDAVRQSVRDFTDLLPQGEEPETQLYQAKAFLSAEGLTCPAQVAFVACTVESDPPGSLEQLHQGILSYVMSLGYLYENVRLQGGAYGVGASVNLLEGLMTFSSYRDPHVVKTLTHFRGGLNHISVQGILQSELDRALISIVGRDVRPMVPSEQGLIGFKRWYYGIDDEIRQQRRILTLETRTKDIQREAERLLERFALGSTVVISGKEIIRQAGKVIPDLVKYQKSLPV